MERDAPDGRDRRQQGAVFPALLGHWRARRGLSQLDLANASGVSSRHISFLETGRSLPGPEVVVRLAEALDVPLRQVNAMLLAAGHPPRFPESASDAPLPAPAAAVLDLMKAHHEPYPLLVLDAAYRVRDANEAAVRLLRRLLPDAADPVASRLDLAALVLDPATGPAAVVNHAQLSRELRRRLTRELLADPANDDLRRLLDAARPDADAGPTDRDAWLDLGEPVAPSLDLLLRVGDDVLRFVLTVTTFQTPLDVTVQDLRIESWFPGDAATDAACRALAAGA